MTHRRLAVVLFAVGCRAHTPTTAAQALAAAVEGAVDEDAVHHAILHVDTPHNGLSGTWVAGVAHASTGAPMTADTPFLSASIGKLFVAATVLSLEDDGLLSLDDPVERWVPTETLAGLPVDGGDAGWTAVTLRLLLAHRSGLPDYFDTEAHPAHDGAPGLLRVWVEQPDRAWSRAELLYYARQHFTPVGAPGERFHYSDLGYDLLGLAIEGATGQPYAEVVRARLIDPLGLEHTWYHSQEARPEGIVPYADSFVAAANLAHTPALTGDQAGGGLATTAGDLARFLRGLERGEPVSLDRLATDWTPDALSRGLDYGYGAWRFRPGGIFVLLGGLPELTGVSGSTGSFVYKTPDGTVISGTLDQVHPPSRHGQFLLSEVLPKLERLPTPP